MLTRCPFFSAHFLSAVRAITGLLTNTYFTKSATDEHEKEIKKKLNLKKRNKTEKNVKTLAASYLHKTTKRTPNGHAPSFIRVFASPGGPGFQSRWRLSLPKLYYKCEEDLVLWRKKSLPFSLFDRTSVKRICWQMKNKKKK